MFEQVDEFSNIHSDYELALILRDTLISRATGTPVETKTYEDLRIHFLENEVTAQLLPSWVRTSRNLSSFWLFIKPKFAQYQPRRTFIRQEFEPLLNHLDPLTKTPSEKNITQKLQSFDPNNIHDAWQNALTRKNSDPEGAITLARTILESVCKNILDDLGVEYKANKIELHTLYKLTAKALNLAPENHSEKVFKQILGGCSAIINGLGTLRNQLGDAHGKGKMPVKPAKRHAELAVNLAGAMALFLVDTYYTKIEASE